MYIYYSRVCIHSYIQFCSCFVLFDKGDFNMFNNEQNQQPMSYQQPAQQGGYAQPQNMVYGGAQPAVSMFQNINVTDNPVTAEEIAQFGPKGKKTTFNYNLTPKEQFQAKCSHKNKNGMAAHKVPGTNSLFECEICGAQFDIEFRTREEVQDLCDKVANILNQAKFYSINFPADFYVEYMSVLPLIMKLPDVYEAAKNNFEEVSRTNPTSSYPAQNYAAGGYSSINAFNDVFNMNYGGQYNYSGVAAPQPNGWNQAVQQPVVQQGYYPQGQPVQQQPVQGGVNPFNANAQQAIQSPQFVGPNTYQGPTTPVQQQPAQQAQVNVTEQQVKL